MKLPVFVILFSISFSVFAVAQTTGEIAGTVADSANGYPLAGVNIIILETGGGVSSDNEGVFELKLLEPGQYSLEFSYLGYDKKIVHPVEVNPGELTWINVLMQETFVELDEIEVRGMRYRQTQDDTRTGLIRLHPASASILPGAVEDVMRTLHAMPGVVSRNDFSSQLIIRGGGPDQNLIVMDDVEIFNPYRLYGLISMFNPETVSDINLMLGGFPVRYGDRLSAVLDVRNREGYRRSPIEGRINANITNANLVLEGSAPGGIEGSWLVSARRTYYDLLAGPVAKSLDLVDGDAAFPNFTDLQSKISIGPYNNHRYYINTLVSRDAVNLISGRRRPTHDSIAVRDKTDHLVLGLAWHYYSPSDDYSTRLNLSWYRNRGDSDLDGQLLDPILEGKKVSGSGNNDDIRLYELEISSLYDFSKASLSQEITYMAGRHRFTGGAGADFITTKIKWNANLGQSLKDFLRDLDIPLVDRFEQERSYMRVFGYLSDKWEPAARLVIEPGLRFDVYTILESVFLSPRLNISYALDVQTTLRAGSGRFLQSPGYEKIFGMTQFFDLTDRASVRSLFPEEAIHYVVGLDRWFSDFVYARIESYYKDFNNLIGIDRVPGTRLVADPIPDEDPRFVSGWSKPYYAADDSLTIIPNNEARGYAYGVELFLEKQPSVPVIGKGDAKARGPLERLSGWISYTYSVANRHEYGFKVPFEFDRRHTLNLVMQYSFSTKFETGLSWRYGSGFPHTPPVGVRPRMLVEREGDEIIQSLQTDSRGEVIFNIDYGDYSNRNSARLPDYNRLDVRFNWYTKLWGLNWLFYLDVINIFNYTNVLGYRYSVEGAVLKERAITMLPIIPTFGFSFRF